MSAITVGCEEAYRTSVAVTCDSVDSSIKVGLVLVISSHLSVNCSIVVISVNLRT